MKSVIFSLLTVLIVGNVYAVELVPEKHVRLLVVNEKQTANDTSAVEIDSGKNQIAIRIYKVFGRGSNKKIFESDPFLLTFDASEQDVVILPPSLSSYDQAQRHFKSQPDIKLISNDTEINYEYAPIKGKKGFLPFGDIESLVVDQNKQNGVVFGVRDAESMAVQETGFVPTLEQFKTWYPKMSDADREDLKAWIAAQN